MGISFNKFHFPSSLNSLKSSDIKETKIKTIVQFHLVTEKIKKVFRLARVRAKSGSIENKISEENHHHEASNRELKNINEKKEVARIFDQFLRDQNFKIDWDFYPLLSTEVIALKKELKKINDCLLAKELFYNFKRVEDRINSKIVKFDKDIFLNKKIKNKVKNFISNQKTNYLILLDKLMTDPIDIENIKTIINKQ